MDTAKGIAVLCVIIGHFFTSQSLIGHVIYSFHLPLFFVISGYFVHEFKIRKNLIRSGKGLLLPFLIGTLMEMAAEIILLPDWTGLLRAKTAFMDMFGSLCKSTYLFPMFHGLWLLWFLPCLFTARMLFVIIMNLTKRSGHQWAVRTVIFMFAAFLGMLLCALGYFPWGIEIALVTLPLLYLGYSMREHKIFTNRYRFVIAGIGLAIWAVMLWKGLYIELAMHYWPGFFLTLFESMIAAYVVVCFSQLLDKVRVAGAVFRWIGRNSLTILLVHNVEMRYIPWYELLKGTALRGDYSILAVRICFILAVTGCVSLVRYLRHSEKLSLPGRHLALPKAHM